MTTAQVVETSVTVNNNSPIQDYVHPDDQIQPTFDNLHCMCWSFLAWNKGKTYYKPSDNICYEFIPSKPCFFFFSISKINRSRKKLLIDAMVHIFINYAFKIFLRFWLAKSTRIIHHDHLLITKFGRILRLINR